MGNIKDELQNIILGDGPVGAAGQLKKIQVFLRRNAETGVGTQKQQRVKSEEATELIGFEEPRLFENRQTKFHRSFCKVHLDYLRLIKQGI